MRNQTILLLFLAAVGSLHAEARSTDLCFAESEARQMLVQREKVANVAALCLEDYGNTHVEFFKQNGYAKYFGNRNEDIDTEDKRRKVILISLWPDLFQRFRAEEALQMRAAKGLAEMERLFQRFDPKGFPAYQARKKELNVVERAKDEMDILISQSKPIKLGPNGGLNLQNISCIDMTRRCLGAAFEEAGLGKTWAKIDRLVKKNRVSGAVMQKALGDLGWRILYFNPDTSKNAQWDEEDKRVAPLKPKSPGAPLPAWNPMWGGHELRWRGYCQPDGKIRPDRERGGVLCSDHYELGNETPVPVDDKSLLVDFGTKVPASFKRVPFFVGTAHSGYHVFPGFYGKIIEAHSKRNLTSKTNLEVSAFNPLDQKNGGGPRWTKEELLRTGVIAIPPGYLGPRPPSRIPVGPDGCVDFRPNSPR